MKRFLIFIILCILLTDCVHTCCAFNGQYVEQQYIPYGQPYPLGYGWIPNTPNMYDYNSGYLQLQEHQQQQQSNGFQSLQQMSTQYHNPRYQQIPNQYENQRQIAKQTSISSPDTDDYAPPSLYYSGQHQMQTQYSDPQKYPNFQEQYQTSQVIQHDGRQYETSQYQYQDGTQQTQEQHIVSDYNHSPVESFQYPFASQGQAAILEPKHHSTQNYESQVQTSIVQPVEPTLDELPFNGPPSTSVLDLTSNQRKYQVGELHQNSRQYSQPAHAQSEKYEIAKLNETLPTLKFVAPNAIFDKNIQTDKSQCPYGFQGLLAKPGNCLKFLRCSDRKIYQKICAATDNDIVMPTKSLETLDNFCAHKDFGIYAHPYDCSKFVDCSPNGKFEKDCAQGTVFNVQIQGCDHKYKVQCNAPKSTDPTHTTGIFCPNGVVGQYPYPFSNEHFINCSNSETFVEPCPPGTTFSLSKSYCEVANYRHRTTWNCSSLNVETHRVVSCPESCNASYLYPFDPMKYIICQDSRMQQMSCPSGDVYSITKGICVARDQTYLFDSVRSLQDMQPVDSKVLQKLYKQYNKIVCPTEALGVFPYPFANTKYIKCVDARLLIKRCRPGFLYSISRKLCDIPDHIQSFDTAVPVEIVGSRNVELDIETAGDMISLECPAGVSDNFVYPFLNTRYTKCLNGVTEIETCLSGAIYSIRQKKCLPRNQVDRNDYVEGIETSLKRFSNDHLLGVSCGPDSDGFLYTHPEDWRKFVICENGIVLVKTCDGNKTFDMTQHKCV